MIRIIGFLILWSTICVRAQPNDVLEIHDFNEDGIDDRLECIRELGVHCTFTDGFTKESIDWGDFAWRGAIKSVITVPKQLLLDVNAKVYIAMQREVLPHLKKSPDPSLQWILNANFSKRKLADNPYVDLIFIPNSKWKAGNFTIPSNYYVAISRDSLYRLDDAIRNDSLNKATTAPSGFLAYYGQVHYMGEQPRQKDYMPVATDATYTIYRTRHGVLAQKKNKFKWLFITDNDLTGGPEKLRWESIEEVFLLDDHVLIKQSQAPDPEYQLYLVHIETGMTGRIKIDFDSLLAHNIEFLDLNGRERFSMQEDTVRIGNDIKRLRLPLKDIRKTLDGILYSE
ncbi:hypothetical protein FGM00_15830 [Aggregatimonas sangjinii]|uniref:Uncharacterized protein n=1 Tax=Aggregatimonas sangjinii TaxID=2583587 RepID=A0A5B7SXJ8_9FLAO|nr:hypothetical protein [Aggregatimonas sangjinii]QCX01504.1 hypothetical protein FGM00_15830 [Aggregatimonas sangjinii]